MHRRRRWRSALIATVCLAIVAVAVEAVGVDARTTTRSFHDTLGMRARGGFQDEASFRRVEAWLGRPLRWTVVMADHSSPSAMRSSVWGQLLAPGAVLRERSGSMQITMTVPLAFGRGNGRTEEGRAEIRAKLRETAQGRWDADFVAVARALVAGGHGDAVVRLGHEFTGPFYPWSAQGNADAYIAAYRRAHRAMQQVAPNLRFEWNGDRNTFLVYGPPAYPGDEYVDVIGLDLYYRPNKGDGVPFDADLWNRRYLKILEGHRQFAVRQGKPVSYAEWAVGSVDEPAFIERMHNWFRSLPLNGPGSLLYHSYFNVSKAEFNLDGFPNSARRYRQLFGAPEQGGALTPVTGSVSPTTVTATTVPVTAPPTTTTAGPTTSVAVTTRPTTTSTTTSPPATTTTAAPPGGTTPSAGSATILDASVVHRADRVVVEQLPRPLGGLAAPGQDPPLQATIELLAPPGIARFDVQICFTQDDRVEQVCSRRSTVEAARTGVVPLTLGDPAQWWRSDNWSDDRPVTAVRIIFKDPVTGKLLNTRACGDACFTGGPLPAGDLITARIVLGTAR